MKWSSRNEGFEDKKKKGKTDSPEKTAEIVLKKVRYKRDYSVR